MNREAPNGVLRRDRLHLACALTSVYGAAAVFGFGLLIGLLTEPVPAMPGGVHALAWLVLALMMGLVFVPLAAANRTAAPEIRKSASERLGLIRSKPSNWTQQVDGITDGPADLCAIDSALDGFPQEQTVSAGVTTTHATSHPDIVRVAS